MQIQCSNCGVRQQFKYSAASVIGLITIGWSSYGSALYCPECSAAWHENGKNSGKELDDAGCTIAVIDDVAERNKNNVSNNNRRRSNRTSENS